MNTPQEPAKAEGLNATEVSLLLTALSLLDDDSKSTVVYLNLQKRLQRMKRFWDERLKKVQKPKVGGKLARPKTVKKDESTK